MSENKTTYTIDLDNSEFIQGMSGAVDSVMGLSSQLGNLAKVGGVIAAAYLAVKSTLDLTFEAEKIKQVTTQFDKLASSAGIAGEELKTALNKAADGLVDDTDLLEIANRAIIEMGESASALPQTMELARKATSAFGGELTRNFEAINHAIATGQTRALKNFGIVVDSDLAYRKYAESIGVASNSLSQAGKQQAILNEVLEKGNTQFKDVNPNLSEATNGWQRLKVTVGQIGEALVMLFDRILGPYIRKAISLLNEFATTFKTRLVSDIGTGSEQVAARVEILVKAITDLEAKQKSLGENSGAFNKVLNFLRLGEVQALGYTGQIQRLKEELAGLQAPRMDIPLPEGGAEGQAGRDQTDKDALAKNEQKFQQEMLAMRQQALQQRLQMENTDYEIARNTLEQKAVAEAAYQNKRQEIKNNDTLSEQQKNSELAAAHANLELEKEKIDIDASNRKLARLEAKKNSEMSVEQVHANMQMQRAEMDAQYDQQKEAVEQNKHLTKQQREQEIMALKEQHEMRLAQLEMDREAREEAALNRHVARSNSASDQFATGWERAGLRATNALNNWAARGERAFLFFQTNAVNALTAWGAGTQTAAEAARGFIFGMLGDHAIAEGTLLMMSGIATLNPLKAAGGAGLVAFGGYLKSKAGNASAGISGGVGMSGGGLDSSGGSASGMRDQTRETQQEKQAKAVNIQIHGSYFDTESTRMRLAEMVREAQDATDFSIQKMGS